MGTTGRHARVIVVASTFPASPDDPVPAFVRDQVVAMHELAPEIEWHVLAPHDHRSGTRGLTRHEEFVEHRFHYFWPRRGEELAGRGIMPALQQRPLLYAVLPFLVGAELVALLRLARRLRPVTIYAHWFTPQGLVAAWVARLVGARFVFTTHASDVAVWHKVPIVGGPIVRAHASRAAALTAVSRRSLARLEAFFPDGRWARLAPRAQIVPMGVHLPPPGQAPAVRERTIVFVGRLAEKKGVQVLLRALAAAADDLAGWRVVIGGDGPWRERLESMAAELGVAAEFPGYVTGAAKDELIRSAGIFVVPSIIAADGDAEGLPVSLMEGLAAGRICVATRESGADDLITDGGDGLLVDQQDPAGLAAAIVAASRMTPAETAEMAQRAAARVAELSWPVIARRYLNLIMEDS
ncbi:glycosyltransferase [Actinotalea sp. M2MS4P-6]|uniref:glycosyltransferase n=1 Tax=Actinotalea sp. M2MS4P-6 TaxID=2983762 RepID=UPI0021E4AAA6|nr:glycosyltransferase [Actinotalea sp. M2MS4P-6]MCV2394172.1 glycosyltransferase [Actinotalea sp. M2MS4P-6]